MGYLIDGDVTATLGLQALDGLTPSPDDPSHHLLWNLHGFVSISSRRTTHASTHASTPLGSSQVVDKLQIN